MVVAAVTAFGAVRTHLPNGWVVISEPRAARAEVFSTLERGRGGRPAEAHQHSSRGLCPDGERAPIVRGGDVARLCMYKCTGSGAPRPLRALPGEGPHLSIWTTPQTTHTGRKSPLCLLVCAHARPHGAHTGPRDRTARRLAPTGKRIVAMRWRRIRVLHRSSPGCSQLASWLQRSWAGASGDTRAASSTAAPLPSSSPIGVDPKHIIGHCRALRVGLCCTPGACTNFAGGGL